MEAVKLILDFLKDGNHFVGFLVLIAITFAGIGHVVRGFRKKRDDEKE